MRTEELIRLTSITGVELAFGLSTVANAATTHGYGTFNGTNFDYIATQETVQSADDEPGQLWEAPSVAGDDLVFAPSSFIADSSNANGGAGLGAFDDTHSTFNATIMSTSAFDIEHVILDESGDIKLSEVFAGTGTPTTGAIAFMSGTIHIIDAVNPGDIGTIITFGGAGADFQVFFNIDNGADNTSLYKGLQPPGVFSWNATVDIDVASIVPGATKVELQWNNQLQANSEIDTSALIQKSDGSITVVPEPQTALLISLGLMGIAIRARRQAAWPGIVSCGDISCRVVRDRIGGGLGVAA